MENPCDFGVWGGIGGGGWAKPMPLQKILKDSCLAFQVPNGNKIEFHVLDWFGGRFSFHFACKLS